MLRLVGVEDPADVGAVVAQSLRAWSSVCLLHLLEPDVEEVLNGVVGRERAVTEGAGVLDEERLEVGPRLGLGLTVLAVLPYDTVDIAVAGARLPRPALQPEATDLAVGADHQPLSGHFFPSSTGELSGVGRPEDSTSHATGTAAGTDSVARRVFVAVRVLREGLLMGTQPSVKLREAVFEAATGLDSSRAVARTANPPGQQRRFGNA